MPPTGERWDYQIGGARDVPDDVAIVERDRNAEPAGSYAICYVNGFQTQPDEAEAWVGSELILRDGAGEPIVDEAWGEFLLDISTPAKRAELAHIVGSWITGCADDGFDAVELDNLDSYLRSDGRLEESDADAYAMSLVEIAHRADLAVAQKNRAGWDGTSVGFDFAVVEECGAYDECGAYVEAYGDAVLIVEYTDEGFEAACEEFGDRLAIVRRDLDLASDGDRAWCD